MKEELKIASIKKINKLNNHHEYLNKPLPAFARIYNPGNNIKVYVSAIGASFQAFKQRSWRWFDFLWTTHTTVYEVRNNFNTSILRLFSILGLITVLSGFLLWFVSSKPLKKIKLS